MIQFWFTTNGPSSGGFGL